MCVFCLPIFYFCIFLPVKFNVSLSKFYFINQFTQDIKMIKATQLLFRNSILFQHFRFCSKNTIKNSPVQDEDPDFRIIDRRDGSSLKYFYALDGKSNVNQERMIIPGMADMEFPFSSFLTTRLKQAIDTTHFGYPTIPPSVKKTLYQWLHKRYNLECKEEEFLDWPNMFCVFYAILMLKTRENDKVLFLTPAYDRMLKTVKWMNRKPIQYVMETKNNRFEINFQKLQEIMKNEKPNMFVLVSPENPTGRIFSRQQLTKLKDLLLKYKIFLYSDQIYADFCKDGEFTSMFQFKQLHQNMVYASSHTKTFNCSGMGMAYSFTANQQLQKSLKQYRYFTGSQATALSYALMKICSQGTQWRKKTIDYINENYRLFRKLLAQKLPNAKVYDLESAYLVLVDFKQYTTGQQCMKRINAQDLFPISMDYWFVQPKPIPWVRFNMALNRKFIPEIVDRLAKAFIP